MGWLSAIFGRRNALGLDSLSSENFSSSLNDDGPVGLSVPGSSVPNARQLIMQCANQTIKLHGIPADWLKLELLTMADEAKAYFQLQITLKHWDAYLLLHSHAFELAVMNRVREQNLAVSRSMRAVLWRVAPDAGCPYEQMPPSVAWTSDAIAQRTSNPQMFKTNKPAYVAPKNWQPQDHAATVFQDTHCNEDEVDKDLAQALEHARAMRQNTP